MVDNRENYYIYCHAEKKIFKSNEKHDIGHFKSFFCIPDYMEGYTFKEMKYFGENRKIFIVYSGMFQKEFIYKIYYGMSPEQLNVLSFLEELQHENLLVVLKPIEIQRNAAEVALRFDYFPNSLLRFIEGNPIITIRTFSRFFSQICDGLIYLHTNKIIHGNLELDSIFIDGPKGKEVIKIGAIEKAYHLEDLENMRIIDIGNRNYLAPEIIEGDKTIIDLSKIDVWNLGILMCKFLNKNQNPFQGSNLMKTQYNILNLDIPQYTNIPKANEIILGCLKKYPPFRMSLEEVKKSLDNLKE